MFKILTINIWSSTKDWHTWVR